MSVMQIRIRYNNLSVCILFKPSQSFKKVRHKVPMLSLGNVFNENDLNLAITDYKKRDRRYGKIN